MAVVLAGCSSTTWQRVRNGFSAVGRGIGTAAVAVASVIPPGGISASVSETRTENGVVTQQSGGQMSAGAGGVSATVVNNGSVSGATVSASPAGVNATITNGDTTVSTGVTASPGGVGVGATVVAQ